MGNACILGNDVRHSLGLRFFLQWLEHFVKSVVISNVETNNNLLEGVELPMNLQSIIPWKKEERSLARERVAIRSLNCIGE